MSTCVVAARPKPDLADARLSVELDAVLLEAPDRGPATHVDRARAHEAEAFLVASDVKAAVCAGQPPIDPLW